MDPVIISGAYLELHLLKHKSWIDISSIDLWLLDMWRSMFQARFLYLPSFFIPSVGQGAVSREEIDHFRSFFPLLPPTGTSCPYENVLYVLNTGGGPGKSGNHFCVLAFIPASRLIYIIGRKYNSDHVNYNNKDWTSWDGTRIWTRVCALFGWNLPPMRLCSVNWVQNGYDCGPIACQISQHLMQNGLRELHWKRPKLPCCHPLRKKMVERINELIWEGFQDFDSLEGEQIQGMDVDGTLSYTWTELMNTLRDAFYLDPASEVKKIIQNLDKAMQDCQHCYAMLEEIEDQQAAAICPIPVRKKSMRDAAQAREKELLKGTRSMAAFAMTEEATVEMEDLAKDDEEEEEEEEEEDKVGGPDKPKPKGHGAFVVGDWTQARIGRFPRPKKGPELEKITSLRGLQSPFDINFDDYYNGPTLADLHPIPQSIMGYDTSLVYLANRVTSIPWTLFKDYGYRLLPNFAQSVHLGAPMQFREHLCPIGLHNPPKSITAYHDQRYARDGVMVDTNDLIHLGAQELLDLADEELDDTIILTGKTQEDEYILLDLQQDAVQPDELLYSCDIDSLIWITQTPKFIGPFGLYANPVIRDKAPIWKNNHVTVELLFPQSDEDKEEGGMREEWWTKPFSLSNIPHLLFGLLQQGSPQVEILLFFPRMTHKHPYLHFSETLIPKHIQNILWDRVILPSIRSALPETVAVYFPVDRAHSRFKQGLGKGNFARTPLYPIQGDNMIKIVKEMKRLVRNDPSLCINKPMLTELSP